MKKKSGVDENIYTKYEFDDHIWATNTTNTLILDLMALTEYITKIDGEYWIYDPETLAWNRYKDQDAKKHAFNVFLNYKLDTGRVATQELIETYFSGYVHYLDKETGVVKKKDSMGVIGSCPQVGAVMSIPIGPTFVTYNGKRYLNEWRDNSIAGSEEHLSRGLLTLRLLYRSLCAGEELAEDPKQEAELLWQQVKTDTYKNLDFKFVMKWLAALVQRPGINLLTNLWFVGELEGNGKGTLLYIMKLILGNAAVGSLSSSDIIKGWNDHLIGKQLIEVNEFDDGGIKFDWNRWVKAHCNEPTLLIAKRNTTPFAVINTANYIFTTNHECPLNIGPSDRRNHFVKTTDNADWVRYASAVKTQVIDYPVEMAAGFAFILESVKIDIKFSNYSFINAIKKNILESVNDAVSVWISEDDKLEKNNGYKYKAVELYELYSVWSDRFGSGTKKVSIQIWGKLMKKNKYVRHTMERNYTFYTIQDPGAVKVKDWEEVYKDVEKVLGGVSIGVKADTNNTNNDMEILAKNLPKTTDLEKIRALLRENMENDGFLDDLD